MNSEPIASTPWLVGHGYYSRSVWRDAGCSRSWICNHVLEKLFPKVKKAKTNKEIRLHLHEKCKSRSRKIYFFSRSRGIVRYRRGTHGDYKMLYVAFEDLINQIDGFENGKEFFYWITVEIRS